MTIYSFFVIIKCDSVNNNYYKDMNMWYDSEVYGGHKKSNVSAQDIYYGPNNKRNAPCDSCEFASTCNYECKAFTMWIDKGDYDTDKIADFKNSVWSTMSNYEQSKYY